MYYRRTLRMLSILPFFLVLMQACGDEPGAGTSDARVRDSGSAIDGDTGCGTSLDCATWIQGYERDVVSKLSGHSPIAVGLTITARFTEAERDATREYIAQELTLHGLTVERHNYGTGTNIFARLPATSQDASLVLLGSHFDGIEISPAAGDDGTGVALVLAAARYFSGIDQRPNDMIFAFFDEEEIGLVGSEAFAAKLRLEEPSLAAAHIYDLISWDEDRDGAVELWSPDPAIEALYRSVGAIQGVDVQAVSFGSSDHASFIENGFAAVGVSEEFVSGDNNPFYHTSEDTYENVDFDFLERISRLAFAVGSRAQ